MEGHQFKINLMPFIKVYIHFVWTTKNGLPFLNSPKIREAVWQHIRKNAREKGIFVDFVNGYADHCHCLISLGNDQTMKKVMHLIKGESSHWINSQKFLRDKFEWQKDYYAVSVSSFMIDRVRDYIANQEEHHKQIQFQEEYDEYIKKYRFTKFDG